jgi:hypothetical protein
MNIEHKIIDENSFIEGLKKINTINNQENPNNNNTPEPREQNQPLNENLIPTETSTNSNTLIDNAISEANELISQNEKNPCFSCNFLMEAIFKNRKGRLAIQAQHCKKCEHSLHGRFNFPKNSNRIH